MINHYRVDGNFKAKIDTPVAIAFFTRYQTLKKVFNEVRQARPGKLFLIQNGKRENSLKILIGNAMYTKTMRMRHWELPKGYSVDFLGYLKMLTGRSSWKMTVSQASLSFAFAMNY